MLNLDSLPDATRRVFERLKNEPLLGSFTLIGGTALALQIGHRRSEDLDFWLPGNQLDKTRVSTIVRNIQQAGVSAVLATPHSQIVAARINGLDLLAQSQDYVIGGAKVTFFARLDVAYQYFDTLKRLDNGETGTAFQIMGHEGLFEMKSYVIHQRIRSRDLLDLKALMLRGKGLADILAAGGRADPACSAEYAKSVLVGEIPLDKNDEGFDSIGVTESVQDIHEYFKDAVSKLEQDIAEGVMVDQWKSESVGALALQWNAKPAKGDERGVIKALSDAEVIQDAGRGRCVVWQRAKLTGLATEVGKRVAISRSGVVSELPTRGSDIGLG